MLCMGVARGCLHTRYAHQGLGAFPCTCAQRALPMPPTQTLPPACQQLAAEQLVGGWVWEHWQMPLLEQLAHAHVGVHR